MTNRIQLFIDGTWLTKNRGVFARGEGREVVLDFKSLPAVVAAKAAAALGSSEYSLTETHFFGSIPVNYDPQDKDLVNKQRAFYGILRDLCRYNVEIYPLDFKGNRIQKEDRKYFTPKEKEVDGALGTALVDGAATDAFDTAICVLGDLDHMPAVVRARKHGKKIVLASVGGSCSKAYVAGDTIDAPILWLEGFFSEIELHKTIVCAAAYHPAVRTREFTAPVKSAIGESCYCELCAKLALKLRLLEGKGAPVAAIPAPQTSVEGIVTKVVPNKGFGFITARGQRYFFHVSDLVGMAWASVKCGMSVMFDIGNAPSADRAGKSLHIRPCGGGVAALQPG